MDKELGLTITLELESDTIITSTKEQQHDNHHHGSCPSSSSDGNGCPTIKHVSQPLISSSSSSSCSIDSIIPQAFPANCLMMDDQENDGQQQQERKQPVVIKLARHVFLKLANNQNKKNHKQNRHRHRHRHHDDVHNSLQQWTPTPIQLQSWTILTSRSKDDHNGTTSRNLNLIAIAPTGSGKTLGYAIPMVQTCLERVQNTDDCLTTETCRPSHSRRKIHGLVLVPTRELSIQVSKVLQLTAKSANQLLKRRNVISSMAIYGGIKKDIQVNELLGVVDDEEEGKTDNGQEDSVGICSFLLLSATPMRLIDLLGLNVEQSNDDDDDEEEEKRSMEDEKRHVVQQQQIIRGLFHTTQFLVIDEADRMATHVDISQQVGTIVRFLKDTSSCLDHQCLYSATLPERALPVCHSWISTPRVSVRVNAVTVGGASHDVISNHNHNHNQNHNHKQQEQPIVESNLQSVQGATMTTTTTITSTVDSRCKGPKGGRIDLSTIPSHIEQILHVCSNHKKPRKLLHTIDKIRKGEQGQHGSTDVNSRRRNKGLMIVFFGRIKTLQYVEKLLQKEGIRCLPFHSQMNQQKREQQLNLFKSGKIPILLATDIAARGIHCNNIEYIINYDFPSSLEQYVHRCGRAGRNQQVHGNDGNGSDGNAKSTQSSTVYSFFHRELAPMAKDVVDLLTKCKSWIDPNLLALVPGSEQSMEEDAEPPKRKRRKRDKETSVTTTINDKANYFENDTHVNMKDTKVVDKDDHDDEEEDDEFASLVQNRIIFERASHVKDDSDGDDESINQD